jgi:riboflavin biosynthesis pyrimidine reductase
VIEAVSGLALEASVTNPRELAESYGKWGGIRTNHVINSAGDFFDESGSSRGISTKEDLELLIELRKLSDLVIVDAETARNEKYRKLSSTHLAIVSHSGDFTGIPAASATTGVTLFSPARPTSNTDEPAEHFMISPSNPFRDILDWAYSQQMDSLLLESGPTLTKLAFESNLVSQSAITVTPELPPGRKPEEINPFSNAGQLKSVARADGAIFTLWSY